THSGPLGDLPEVAAAKAAEATELPAAEAPILLFATRTCPNCKVAASKLDKAGIAYEKIYADENPEMAEAYGIRQAPTLVVPEVGGYVKYTNVSNITKYLESR
ncbi:MAG: glutaredoxin family protein, partial [Clostridia bacterium]|nr:glutaredoxin family protein [Clostridia bacterium]